MASGFLSRGQKVFFPCVFCGNNTAEWFFTFLGVQRLTAELWEVTQLRYLDFIFQIKPVGRSWSWKVWTIYLGGFDFQVRNIPPAQEGAGVNVNTGGSWPFGDLWLYVCLLPFHMQDVTLFCEFRMGLMSAGCWGLTSCCTVAFQPQRMELCLCSSK